MLYYFQQFGGHVKTSSQDIVNFSFFRIVFVYVSFHLQEREYPIQLLLIFFFY